MSNFKVAPCTRSRIEKVRCFGLILYVLVTAGWMTLSSGANAQQGINPRQTERNIDSLLGRERGPGPNVGLPSLARGTETADSGLSIKLNSVSIEGATQIDREELSATYRGYIGRTVRQKDLNEIAAAIGAMYRERGFHLSRAIIPPQDVANGRLRIKVVEGWVADIVIKGDERNRFGIARVLSPIGAERPARLSTLERYLFLANERFGVRLADTTVEEIGTGTGKFRLTVAVETWRIYSAFGIDNWGTGAVGELQTYLATAYNSTFFAGDTLGIDISVTPEDTKELRFGRIYYDMPLGNEGARVGWSGGYSEIHPGDVRRLTNTKISVESYEIRGSINPINEMKQSLRLIASTGFLQETEQNDLGTTYRDRVMTISGVMDYRSKDNYGGWNYLLLGARQGLNVFGASHSGDPLLSRADGSGSFTKLDFASTRIQRISEIFSAKLSVSGQWASRPLLSSQEFYLGGANYGRAFNSGLVSGDHALAVYLEGRYDRQLPYTYLKGYQLYSFIDGGAAYNIGGADYSVVSAGAGTRLFFAQDWLADVGFAIPVGYSLPGTIYHNDTKIYFSLTKYMRLCTGQGFPLCS